MLRTATYALSAPAQCELWGVIVFSLQAIRRTFCTRQERVYGGYILAQKEGVPTHFLSHCG